MRRIGVSCILLLVALFFVLPATFGDGKRPSLKAPKPKPKKSTAEEEESSSLEKLILDNVPADFPLDMKWPFYSKKLGKVVNVWYQPKAEFFIDANRMAMIEGNVFLQTDDNTLCALSEATWGRPSGPGRMMNCGSGSPHHFSAARVS